MEGEEEEEQLQVLHPTVGYNREIQWAKWESCHAALAIRHLGNQVGMSGWEILEGLYWPSRLDENQQH
jgi:hypothetical protein